MAPDAKGLGGNPTPQRAVGPSTVQLHQLDVLNSKNPRQILGVRWQEGASKGLVLPEQGVGGGRSCDVCIFSRCPCFVRQALLHRPNSCAMSRTLTSSHLRLASNARKAADELQPQHSIGHVVSRLFSRRANCRRRGCALHPTRLVDSPIDSWWPPFPPGRCHGEGNS